MGSNILRFHVQPFITTNPFVKLQPLHLHCQVSSFEKPKTLLPPLHSSLSSSSSSPIPPSSRDEAILQAKTCLSTTLQKPLNNSRPIAKLKKSKQPRLRIEIPIIDDSPESLSQLALDLFQDLPIKRKGSPVKLLIIWPHTASSQAAIKAFQVNSKTQIEHIDMASVSTRGTRSLNPADVAVLLAPESSDLGDIEVVSDSFYPKPVVMFNPKWRVEDESGFGELKGFVGSFDVIYSFVGLEVKGILSSKRGVIFKCVRDGMLNGVKWSIHVEEDGKLKAISTFKTRPSMEEVETVLYNVMAANSPITKSAKFLKNLVSNVTGKKTLTFLCYEEGKE